MKKSKRLYNTITSLTLALPILILFVYLFVTGNKGYEIIIESPKFTIPGIQKDYDFINDPNDYWDINIEENYFVINNNAGLIHYEDLIIDGFLVINIPELFSINGKFYQFDQEGNMIDFNYRGFIDDNLIKTTFVIGIFVIIGGIAALMVVLTIMKKMDFARQHRRLSVLVSLWIFTLIALLVSLISDKFFLTFLVSASSWTVYYIEWAIYRLKNGLPLSDKIVERVSITHE